MTAGIPPLVTLADRVTWLIEQAHPAGEQPMSDYDVCRLIHQVTGQTVSRTAIWKLRTGRTLNPSWELIDALARTFGVPAGWFSASMDDVDSESLTAQIALLTELRDLGFQGYHLATMRKVDPRVRGAIITMIEEAGRALASSGNGIPADDGSKQEGKPLPSSSETPSRQGKPGTEVGAVPRKAQ
jgi:transcriptional regulator with XRE-family HTH domain